MFSGPAIRLGPNEVHVYDPEFFHELYSPGSKYYKDPSMHKVLGAPASTLAESDPIIHKQRRAPLESLFAKKNISRLEPLFLENIEYCSRRFDELYNAGRPVFVEWALKSLAMGMFTPWYQFSSAVAKSIRHRFAVRLWQVIRCPGRSGLPFFAGPCLRSISHQPACNQGVSFC